MRRAGRTTSQLRLRVVWLLLWGACLSAMPPGVAAAQDLNSPAIRERFAAASRASGPLSLDDALLILQAISSADETVARNGLGMIEARLSPYRTDIPAEVVRADWNHLNKAEPRVLELLDAREPRVRSAAIRGITLLRAAATGFRFTAGAKADAGWGLELGGELVDRLARMFATEASASVRNDLVGALAVTHSNVDSATVRTVNAILTKALGDESYGVVNAALREIVRRKLPASLEESVRLLRHKDYQVRVVAAQMVASFGRDARPHLPDLRRAAESETHDITKKTILGTISVVER